MRIDSHQHFWRLDRGDYTWLTRKLRPIYRDFQPADLAPILHLHDIDGDGPGPGGRHPRRNRLHAGSGSRRPPLCSGVVGWVDFDAPHAVRDVERLSHNPRLKGLRPMIQDIAHPEWMLQPALRPVIEAMQRHGLRFDALLKPPHLAPFRKFLTLYPDLPVVIDHGAKPGIAKGEFDDWAKAMREIAQAIGASIASFRAWRRKQSPTGSSAI